MKKNNSWVIFPIICLALFSCSTPKNIAYFQDVEPGETIAPQRIYDIRVRPEDKLSIIVSTQDAGLSALFNLVQVQNRLTGNSAHTINPYNTDSRTSYYTVDDNGDINFPVIGKIHIGGMKRSEVAEYIEKRLIAEDLVKKPVVSVEFVNTGVYIMGEVATPGRYEFNKDRLTVVEALTIAGDLKNTGRRDNIMVIRETDQGKKTYVIDLTNASELSKSPGFYLQQEDMVYVEPNDKAKRETTSAGNTIYTPGFWISVGSLGVTVATLLVTLTR